MEKRFIPMKEGLEAQVVIPLSEKEVKQLERKDLRKQIDAAAKDFNVLWCVEQANIPLAIIARVFTGPIAANDTNALETDALCFMRAVELMDTKKPEKRDSQAIESLKELVKKVKDGKIIINGIAILVEDPNDILSFLDVGMLISANESIKMIETYIKSNEKR